MSAPDPAGDFPPDARGCPLLVIIDPAARRADGESVRIARDVLCARAEAKICLPDGPEEVARALARRGGRRPVIVGDDRALLQVVRLLHQSRELAEATLSVVPVGTAARVGLTRSLGVPPGPVAAARAVLDGCERRLDLLLDDSGGVVLGGLRIPCGNGSGTGSGRAFDHPNGRGVPLARVPQQARPHPWWTPAARTARSALSLLARPVPGLGGGAARRREQPLAHRLRIEADGVLLADLDQPVHRVAVTTPGSGLAEVLVHAAGADAPARARARAITVSGPDFRYRADALVGGPVRTRTWTVLGEAWRLLLPA